MCINLMDWACLLLDNGLFVMLNSFRETEFFYKYVSIVQHFQYPGIYMYLYMYLHIAISNLHSLSRNSRATDNIVPSLWFT